MSRSPDLSEVLERVRETAGADVRVSCVARVVRWDKNKPREVDVQPVHKRSYLDEEGTRTPEKQPVIPSVPLVYPGGNGLVITWPMTVGDEVLLVFSDESLDKYLAGAGGDIDPGDDRKHAMTDAVAFAGIRSLSAATSVDASAVQIGTNGGAFQGAALGADLKTYLDTLKAYIDNHTHAVSVVGVQTGVTTIAATAIKPSASSSVPTLESTTVKVTP